MAFDFQPTFFTVTLDEFSNGLAPAILEQTFREDDPGGLFVSMSVQVTAKDADGVWIGGMLAVVISAPLTVGQQNGVINRVAAHVGGASTQPPDERVEDLAGPRIGEIRYVRRAPKEGESGGTATGTLVYRDHLGAWRRVSDDAVLKAAP